MRYELQSQLNVIDMVVVVTWEEGPLGDHFGKDTADTPHVDCS